MILESGNWQISPTELSFSNVIRISIYNDSMSECLYSINRKRKYLSANFDETKARGKSLLQTVKTIISTERTELFCCLLILTRVLDLLLVLKHLGSCRKSHLSRNGQAPIETKVLQWNGKTMRIHFTHLPLIVWISIKKHFHNGFDHDSAPERPHMICMLYVSPPHISVYFTCMATVWNWPHLI